MKPLPQIGPHVLSGRAVLAPMAGLTDQVFRNICRNFGAALAVSEMNTSDKVLWNTRKSMARLDLSGDNGLRVLQIAGSEPDQMAAAAHAAAGLGADIVDINMGCPAKKVCRKLSGSALLRDEDRVAQILDAVTRATCLPVTLKMRTGWDPEHRNGVRVARLAEAAGIKSLAVHGRTRACLFTGNAEYETIRAIKAAVDIPVFANGDICTAADAYQVLSYTGADGIMIGRGALGQPWIFAEINQHLQAQSPSGQNLATPIAAKERRDIILFHLAELYRFYGKEQGVRVGRKHLSWYCKYIEGARVFRDTIVRIESAEEQLQLTRQFFDNAESTLDLRAAAFSSGSTIPCLPNNQSNVSVLS